MLWWGASLERCTLLFESGYGLDQKPSCNIDAVVQVPSDGEKFDTIGSLGLVLMFELQLKSSEKTFRSESSTHKFIGERDDIIRAGYSQPLFISQLASGINRHERN